MQRRPLIYLAVALVLGVAAVFLVQNFLDQATTPVAQPGAPALQTQSVVVAAVPLFFGSMIEAEHIKLVKWPADSMPPGVFTSLDQVIGGEEQRVALRAIEPHEPILASKVSGKGGRLSMSGLISGEMRAATIRVNDIVGVGGFVLPGDRVDVLLTRQIGKKDRTSRVNDVILQNARVLGIDQDANEARNQPGVAKSVTLEVTARQAQKLALAQQVGSLSLALRHLSNISPERTKRITTADLRYSEINSPKKRKVRRVARGSSGSTNVKVIRGFASTSYKVRRQKTPSALAGIGGTLKTPSALPAVPPEATPLPAMPKKRGGEPLDLLPKTGSADGKSDQRADLAY